MGMGLQSPVYAVMPSSASGSVGAGVVTAGGLLSPALQSGLEYGYATAAGMGERGMPAGRGGY